MGKVIGIDLDSTLNNLTKKWIDTYNEEYNDNLTINDITEWDLSKIVKPECGKKIFDIIHRPGFFYENMEVIEGSQDVTKWLIEKKKYDIYIVTAYFPNVLMDKFKWLEKYFPHISLKKVIPCNFKNRFNGDFLIDDGGHNIRDFNKANKDSVGLLLDLPCPWNHNYTDIKLRMKSWEDIRTYFKENV